MVSAMAKTTTTLSAAPSGSAAAADASLDTLEARICTTAAHLAANMARWLADIATFDRRLGWQRWEARSMVHWLSWRCAVSETTAREHVRVAHALEALPLTYARFAAGELSYSKVRAITRVARSDTEADLIDIALHATAAQFDRLAAGYRRATESERRTADDLAHEKRALRWNAHPEGIGATITLRLTAEQAAVVLAAVDAVVDADGPPRPDADGRAQRRADALVALVTAQAEVRSEIVLHAPIAGHLPSPTRPANPVHDASPARDASLARDADPVHDAHLAGTNLPLSLATVERLCCDSAITWLLEDENGLPAGVTPPTARIPQAVRRAVERRDVGCQFPGCSRTVFLDVHHIVWRSRNGSNAPDNLVLLCRLHHRALHEGGYTANRTATGRLAVRRPDGSLLPDGALADVVPVPISTLTPPSIEITEHTVVSRWVGDGLDVGYAVSNLMERERWLDRQGSS